MARAGRSAAIARDRVLLAAGFRTARITWWDLSAPATLEAELTAMLAVASAHRAA